MGSVLYWLIGEVRSVVTCFLSGPRLKKKPCKEDAYALEPEGCLCLKVLTCSFTY